MSDTNGGAMPPRQSAEQVRRGRQMIYDATKARAARLRALDLLKASMAEAACGGCARVLFQYEPPLKRVVITCKRCGYTNLLWGEGTLDEALASILATMQ